MLNLALNPLTVAVLDAMTLGQQTQNLLRRYSGSLFDFQPTIYSDSAATTPAVVDGVLGIGNVPDRVGALTLTQATSASHPLWRHGAKNLLTYSQQLDNAVWQKTTCTVTPNTVPDPFGGTSTDTVDITGSGGSLYNSVSIIPGLTYCLSFWCKLGTQTQPALAIYDQTHSSFIAVDVSYGASSASLDRFNYAFTIPAGCTTIRYYPQRKTGGGVGTSYIFGAQLELGSTPSEYVATGSSPASNGVWGYWAEFDDTDDKLTFSAVPFGMADDHILIIPAQPTAAGRLYSAGNTASATPQISLGVTAAGYLDAIWKDDAGTTAQITGSTDIRGQKHVCEMRKAGDAKSLWMDGVQIGATDNTAMGTTTLNVAKVGCLASTTDSDFVGGGLYGIVPLKGQPSASELGTVRRYLATLIGVSL